MENSQVLSRKVVRNIVRKQSKNKNVRKVWELMQTRKYGVAVLHAMWHRSGKVVPRKDVTLTQKG